MKSMLRIALWLAVCAFANAALADTYPDKPVKIIAPFAPGGPTDFIARVLADKLSTALGKQFFVANQAGASGNIGTGMAATSPADGYTLVISSTGFMMNPLLFDKVPYDAVKDFAPISLIASSANVLTITPSVPAKTVKELVALIKASPGKYSFASPGIGSTPHLAADLLRVSQGLDIVAVVFGGAGPAIQSTIGGHTPLAFSALGPAVPQVKAGLLRALAVTSNKRAPVLPDVPTMAEAGYPGQESFTLTGILAPAGTPKEIVTRLHAEIAKLVATPEVRERFDAQGFDPVASTPEEFAARITFEMEKWGKIIKDAGIKPITSK